MNGKIRFLLSKWSIALKILPIVIAVLGVKLFFHYKGWEAMSMNALFTSIIGGTIFLLGFLISGVLSDYKESEKIPGELACSIELLHDETSAVYKAKKSKEAKDFLTFQLDFIAALKSWFYRKESIESIFNKVSSMNEHFAALEGQTQVAYISRMKQEQNLIRKAITRVHTIRETSFVMTAYAIVETLAFFLMLGLVIVKMEPFYESLFFVAIVSFLVLYMIFLIKDLDDPFDYSANGESGSEVSLQPIHDLEIRLSENVKKMI
jgi:predicted membrane chloride channel (bestrophin family)